MSRVIILITLAVFVVPLLAACTQTPILVSQTPTSVTTVMHPADTPTAASPDRAQVESRNDVPHDFSQGGCDAAVPYTAVIQAKPVDAKTLCNRGKAYFSCRIIGQAIRDWDTAIELKPDYAEAYYNRGLAYILEGNVDQGMPDLDKAEELQPDYVGLYALRALIRQLDGDLDRAIADWDKAIQLQPDLVMAYANRGLAYHDKGDLDRAIADWGEAIRLQPTGAGKQSNTSPAASDTAELDCAVAIADWEYLIRPAPDPETLSGLHESARRALQERTSVAVTPRASWCAPVDIDEFTAMPGGNSGANWAIIDEFIFPETTRSVGQHTYTFWFEPCHYVGTLPDHLTRSFVVTSTARRYDDPIYLGPLGPSTSASAYGPLIEAIHPAQPLIARLNDIGLSQAEAKAVARECVNWITLDDGERHQLVPRAPCQYSR